MAIETNAQLRNQAIYSIFVRNYSVDGNFAAVTKDLPRIKKMGFNIIWLLPIYPIGKQNRKGALGSPYAIQDYRGINPEYGTLDDFKELVDQAHALQMRVILDIVYNHTSPDSVLSIQHPNWFYHDKAGNFGNRVADWSDVIDLDYGQRDLWQYQIDTLLKWAEIVDGFRCDVAPLVPLAFWREARRQVNSKYPNTIWLAESAGRGFIQELRGRGLTGLSDGELFQAFDMTYDYDVFEDYQAFLHGEILLQDFVRELNIQDASLPANYVKMRFLENHDNPRATNLLPGQADLINNLTWIYLQKGIPLVYAGQEYLAQNQPSLFEKDTIDADEHGDLTQLIAHLNQLKQLPVLSSNNYRVEAVSQGVVKLSYQNETNRLTAWIPLRSQTVTIPCDLKTGDYVNEFSQEKVQVANQQLVINGQPVIVLEKCNK